jgi:hypothetical protein
VGDLELVGLASNVLDLTRAGAAMAMGLRSELRSLVTLVGDEANDLKSASNAFKQLYLVIRSSRTHLNAPVLSEEIAVVNKLNGVTRLVLSYTIMYNLPPFFSGCYSYSSTSTNCTVGTILSLQQAQAIGGMGTAVSRKMF